MALIITPQKEIDNYFESDNLSQSVLKKLLGGFDSFLSYQQSENEDVKEKQSFIIGSAVDCILTGEEGEFDNQYYVSQIVNKPSDAEMNIVKSVYDELISNNIEIDLEFKDYTDMILTAIEEFNWQPRWKPETKLNKIIDLGTEYFNDLVLATGKQVLSESQNTLITDIVESLRNNPKTASFFDRSSFRNNIHVDAYYQLPIFFNYKGIDCKALLDLVLVFKNTETNQIESIQPIDLKTMYGPTINFLNSVKQWRYDIQAAWYTLALINWLDSMGWDGVYIKPYQFIVESTSQLDNPLVFTMSEELMTIGRQGRPEFKTSHLSLGISNDTNVLIRREIRGFESLIDEYIYYSNNEWKEDKRITEGNGVLKLDWDGINI